MVIEREPPFQINQRVQASFIVRREVALGTVVDMMWSVRAMSWVVAFRRDGEDIGYMPELVHEAEVRAL